MEENNSILSDLCSQKYFKDIFAKSTKSLAFTSTGLKIIWSNENFRKTINNKQSLADFYPEPHKDGAYSIPLKLKGITGSLIFFPIIFENQLLGYTVLFKEGKEGNDIFELNAAKHDFNNLLTLVFNLLHLTDKENLANAGLGMANDFLENFSLNILSPGEISDIKDALTVVYNSFAGSSSGSVNIKSDISHELNKVRINRIKFIRIISNLITNALEATPAGGIITLSAFNTTDKGKDFVCVTVEDTGSGISGKELKKIFNKDYSTKNRGSGLGLSIVKKLVDEIKSSIEVESRVGKGTKFTLKFPAAAGVKKNIALIEDDKAINELLTDLLSAGYNVYSYYDGESFLAAKNIMELDLIIVDKKLPGIDGIECINEVCKKERRVKVILASGSETEVKDLSSLPEIDRIINKPYKFDQLLSVVEELLA